MTPRRCQSDCLPHRAAHRRRSRGGFAVVMVLGILALLVVLAVGFLMRAGSERVAASGYQASISARHLGDTVVTLVQGQINLATSQGAGVPWISQPGMVRTFNPDGSLRKAYKLYSSDEMISSAVKVTNGKADDEAPTDWASSPGLWSDLNAPVEVGGVKNFPILDPPAEATKPEGYAVTSAPGATAYQPVPMPVKWLYVLRDGKLVAPTGSGNTVTVAGDVAASNPIVGRVAFWTDDDTCKVNINTASEGTYWDTPRAGGAGEVALGNYQPAQREWQRYSGHPAMTCLSSVLPDYTAAQIYNLVPRVVGGGSTGGTLIPVGALTPDTNRLYSGIDELVFDPERNVQQGLTRNRLEQAKFFLTAHSRAPETNLFNLPRVSMWPVFKGLSATRVTAFDKLLAFCSSVGPTASLSPYYFQRESAYSGTNDIAIARNLQVYNYLSYLMGQPIPGFGSNTFKDKYGADSDQILTEIFDYIRSTNLYDDNLAANGTYTKYRNLSNKTLAPSGHGWVAPIHFSPAGGGTTMGFGRSFTLSEVGLGLICNAQADDATTTSTDESHGSNVVGNPVLSGTLLQPGERYIQAILVPEFFSPSLGFTIVCPDFKVEISGLQTMTVTCNGVTQQLFPQVPDGSIAQYYELPVFTHSRDWGGNPGWPYFGIGKGVPARGPFTGDVVGSTKLDPDGNVTAVEDLYPFIGTPIKITAPTNGGTMQFSGGALTIRIYANAKTAVVPADLLQTLHIQFPPSSTFPIPTVADGPDEPSLTDVQKPSKEFWWSFGADGKGRILSLSSPNPLLANEHGRFFSLGRNPGDEGLSSWRGAFFRSAYDVVRTVLPQHGDYRLVAGRYDVPDTVFTKHRYYDDASRNIASNLSHPTHTNADQGYDVGGKYINSITYYSKMLPDIGGNATGSQTPDISGDYDNPQAQAMDGPYINKPDEGDTYRGTTAAPETPYFHSAPTQTSAGVTFFSPNRQIPSPGMLGSLPTGVLAGAPWRTLLFRPQPTHFGATAPKDHLLLDLFWMPVVEPYSISDRFSTAGKINLNYQILPFTSIERSTGLQALFKSEKVGVEIPTMVSTTSYKAGDMRYDVDRDATLAQFRDKFSDGSVFRSASEICDVHIIPKFTPALTAAGMDAFWKSNPLTAENVRERIYTTLYPRMTTRSNTFTVHFRVQALKKARGSIDGSWTEGRDTVTGEYRGSTSLERFINANNPSIPDYAADASTISSLATLDQYYKWRVVMNRQFTP